MEQKILLISHPEDDKLKDLQKKGFVIKSISSQSRDTLLCWVLLEKETDILMPDFYLALSEVKIRDSIIDGYDPLFNVTINEGKVFTIPSGYTEKDIKGEFKKLTVRIL